MIYEMIVGTEAKTFRFVVASDELLLKEVAKYAAREDLKSIVITRIEENV